MNTNVREAGALGFGADKTGPRCPDCGLVTTSISEPTPTVTVVTILPGLAWVGSGLAAGVVSRLISRVRHGKERCVSNQPLRHDSSPGRQRPALLGDIRPETALRNQRASARIVDGFRHETAHPPLPCPTDAGVGVLTGYA